MAFVSGQAAAEEKRQPRPAVNLLPGADADCFICSAVADSQDRQRLVVERSEHSVVLLNRYPYNNGHLLIAPRFHKGQPAELGEHEQLDLQRLITKYLELLRRLMNAEGFNVGLNLGRAAGAGLPGHLHWHVVPRWSGDASFMPVTSGIKVIPQALDALWEMLEEANATGDDA